MLRVLLLLTAVSVTSADAQGRLGTIHFVNSGADDAQEHFVRGVLYLHSFEYDAAAEAFRQAQRVDQNFVLAYWGEAMTYNHPVWDQQDQAAALAALGRLAPSPVARAAKAGTPKERAWLQAVEALYGEGSKPHRDTLYSAALERMATEWPEDLEVQSFYALSLMGLSQATRVVPTYMRAGALALSAMEKNRDHPGATHYAIHAFDDPIHAPLGLPAARAYSRIAPGAAHAQHMTTHIFLALGMWDEVVQQNIVASGADRSRWKPGHYTAWLGYGLLQQGRFADARSHIELVERNMASAGSAGQRGTLLTMLAHHVVNTERWSELPAVPADSLGIGATPRAMDTFARGAGALARGDRGTASAHLDRLSQLSGRTGSGPMNSVATVLDRELRGLLVMATGDTSGALSLLREAAQIEDTLPMEFGPPAIVKPTHELLGEVYLESNRPADAKREFQRALSLAPGRLRSLLGLYRAASADGDTVVVAQALAGLKSVLTTADAGLPELQHLSQIQH